MSVNVVWVTPNAEAAIAYCARVSNPNNQNAQESAPKLLKYLIKNKHWSPFEMANVCMEIETTRDIARQILRHRSFSFQEFSQRYAAVQGFKFSEVRLQDDKNRQNSLELTEGDELHSWWYHAQKRVRDDAELMYDMALAKGVAKEQARKLLPEGMTMSKMYMNGTLRSWIHFIELRSANGTQKEHQEVARACAEAIAAIFPMASTLAE